MKDDKNEEIEKESFLSFEKRLNDAEKRLNCIDIEIAKHLEAFGNIKQILKLYNSTLKKVVLK